MSVWYGLVLEYVLRFDLIGFGLNSVRGTPTYTRAQGYKKLYQWIADNVIHNGNKHKKNLDWHFSSLEIEDFMTASTNNMHIFKKKKSLVSSFPLILHFCSTCVFEPQVQSSRHKRDLEKS